MHFPFQFPTSEDEWKKIAEKFQERWQFPNTVGAVDGKHVRIQPPPGSGSYYFNYKHFHSVVLLGIANANYEFILCDIGTNGRISDGGVIEQTNFGTALRNGTLNLPADRSPDASQTPLPYVFIGDEAFSLGNHFLKPFSQSSLNYQRRIYNYRLSRARRIIENVFGIMSARFRIFGTAMNLSLENIEDVVIACATLHNFLRRKCPTDYTPDNNLYNENTTQGEINCGISADSQSLLQLQLGQNRNVHKSAKEIRDSFLHYFNNEGAVAWQDNMVKNDIE